MALALESFRCSLEDVLLTVGAQRRVTGLPLSVNRPLSQCFKYTYVTKLLFPENPRPLGCFHWRLDNGGWWDTVSSRCVAKGVQQVRVGGGLVLRLSDLSHAPSRVKHLCVQENKLK